MKPPAFSYYRPESVAQALHLLSTVEGAKILAGGQSLIPMMNMRLARPDALVDINHLTELTSIQDVGDALEIGALVRHDELLRSPLVRRHAPLVAQAERLIGHPAIRSRGTIGGSLAHADPAAELPVLAVLGDWELIVSSQTQTRTISAGDFFLSYFVTTLAPEEMLLRIRLPKVSTYGHIAEYAIQAGDFALTIAATSVDVGPSGVVRECRIALGGVTDVPWRDKTIERQAIGQVAQDSLWKDISHTVAEAIDPIDDLHATSAYRRQLAEALLREALHRAAQPKPA
ncbi:MAG: xanthine dehydrogenase family protein subunit M [Firmicutes bacterium]|jgi:CO/xanthine dehydrogenase FAD-binding subunit|uniref:FAD-binding PCMH-type domain-containing protein n=1 Tax=Sulfobacillus benefaciens TaxID=453960 RepID=A0A2T2WTV4_9FIRM|nr:xanthine dehydrogenase family protein subunit M [Bacillota bacterium]MCL5014185.1 xanthine dehydrogenase family protein subunit M [Bacillota bacterium]PSR25623.1 MAG: hypothetical protein C7B43_16395 [Sulfobacillus benefaciens]